MNKTNMYIFKILIVSVIFSPSFYLFSSYKPAGKRPLNYTGPVGPRPNFQKPASPATSKKTDIKPNKPILAPIPEETSEELEGENGNITPEQTDTEKGDLISASKNIQTKPTTSGWLFNAYMAGMPLILVSLDKAVGTGIAASTKNLIKLFLTRKAFSDSKPETLQQLSLIQNAIETTDDIEKRQKLENLFFKGIHNLEAQEKQTSLSNILSQTAYIAMLNTVVPLFATLFGFGAKIALQTFMPENQ
jgi:hypothetical protein